MRGIVMIDWIMANTEGIVQIALQVIGAFAVIAAWTPNTADNKIAQALLELVNFMGFNIGKASNAADPKPEA